MSQTQKKTSAKAGKAKRKYEAKMKPLSLFVRGKITAAQYFLMTRQKFTPPAQGLKTVLIALMTLLISSCCQQTSFTAYYQIRVKGPTIDTVLKVSSNQVAMHQAYPEFKADRTSVSYDIRVVRVSEHDLLKICKDKECILKVKDPTWTTRVAIISKQIVEVDEKRNEKMKKKNKEEVIQNNGDIIL